MYKILRFFIVYKMLCKGPKSELKFSEIHTLACGGGGGEAYVAV